MNYYSYFENETIKSYFKKKLLKNNIHNTKDLILKKPVKYEDFTLSHIQKLNNNKEIKILGTILNNPIQIKTKKNKNAIYFYIILSNNQKIKVIIFNNFFLLKILKKIKKFLLKVNIISKIIVLLLRLFIMIRI
ncbi:hypothetical protein [Candidatus Phytoplasma sacchari]|uniref:OB domain-containing protein n=1 Tax=Candidatus Phytoplasma sacchari TaxID=2609813 RepID=A0ABY7M1P2_9MOLU|nr:hypothetical protein [Candidatus Phytoplasma sacchari]WBL31637.1 hypothetical protein O7R10_01060 [Candidatus Phytoplasma sacchari]